MKSIVIPDTPVPSILSIFQADCAYTVSTTLQDVDDRLTMFAVDPLPLANIPVIKTSCDFHGIYLAYDLDCSTE